MSFNATIILIFRKLIPRIFTNDEEVIQITADAFFVVIAAQCKKLLIKFKFLLKYLMDFKVYVVEF